MKFAHLCLIRYSLTAEFLAKIFMPKTLGFFEKGKNGLKSGFFDTFKVFEAMSPIHR